MMHANKFEEFLHLDVSPNTLAACRDGALSQPDWQRPSGSCRFSKLVLRSGETRVSRG